MNLNDLKNKAANFSDSQFGKDRLPVEPLKHLKEEVDELMEALTNGGDPETEYADCFLLLIDSFRKYYPGLDMQHLIDVCSRKLDINASRQWKLDDDGVYRHIKEKSVHND